MHTVALGGTRLSDPGVVEVSEGVTVANGLLNERGVLVAVTAFEEGVLGLLDASTMLLPLFSLLLGPRHSESKCLLQKSMMTCDISCADRGKERRNIRSNESTSTGISGYKFKRSTALFVELKLP